VNEIRLYFEGDDKLRPGFKVFLREVDDKARSLRIGFQAVACNSTPVEDFLIGVKKHPQSMNVLLRDSEGPDNDRLCEQFGIPQEHGARVFWMIELMESWFIADPESLKSYYGNGFNRAALNQNPRVEEIPKDDVLSCLNRGTKNTQKGAYHKTKHAPVILQKINPAKVRKAAPQCERLFVSLLAQCNGPAD